MSRWTLGAAQAGRRRAVWSSRLLGERRRSCDQGQSDKGEGAAHVELESPARALTSR